MAKTVTVTWTTTSDLVENGSSYTQYRVSLDGPTVHEMLLPFGTASHTFPVVEPGTYMAAVELVNPDASQVGPGAFSEPFDVIDDATLDVPSAVMVQVGAPA